MQRLILEEGGTQRAFRVREGRLTIGSGEGCALRLSSPDVAEQHAELEVGEQGVVLHPKPGVLPPTVQGRPVKSPVAIPPGAEFRIGGARFVLQAEGGAAAPAGAPAAGGARPVTRGGAAVPARPRSVVQLSKPLHRIERGVPGWVIGSIAVAVALVGFFAFRAFFGAATVVSYDPYERLRVAKDAYENAYNERALDELERVDLEKAPELRDEVEALRARIAERDAAAELVEWNARGTEFLETQIKRFFEQRMQGDAVPRERARVFVKRCKEFSQTWPKHPEIGWVERYQERFEPIAELDDPSTYADVAYEVETLTWAKPRDYATAFRLVREFLQRVSGSDYDAAIALEDKLVQERQDYFVDRMQQAKWHWEKNEPSKSVGELVQLIVYIGDEDMENQAAREMLVLPRIDEHLLGYKNHRPDRWRDLLQNELVRAKAGELGML